MQARQFDIFQRSGGDLVVVLQHDLLDNLPTRLIAPLLPMAQRRLVITQAIPVVAVDGRDYVLAVPLIAAATMAELGRHRGSLTSYRDEIIRALDLLFTGI